MTKQTNIEKGGKGQLSWLRHEIENAPLEAFVVGKIGIERESVMLIGCNNQAVYELISMGWLILK